MKRPAGAPRRKGPGPRVYVAAPNAETFGGERLERLKQDLRRDEAYATAAACDGCAHARAVCGDDTALCPAHLEAVLGR